MIYLIVKMLALLLIATAIGAAIGWLLRGARDREALAAQQSRDAARLRDLRAQRDAAEARLAELAKSQAPLAVAPLGIAAAPDGKAPRAMAQPPDGGDDLRQIAGVGPKIEGLLRELGLWRFQQIVDLTPENVAWLGERLRFKGRIEREDWIGQAKILAAGGASAQPE